jgi:polyketide cyclase/dehydrase/lipid transport protein
LLYHDTELPIMAKSHYSIVLNHPAEEVWAVIRPFDHYAWAGVQSETSIEAGKAGDQVGAIRRITMGEKIIRQILLAHSDLERSYTYALCDPPPFPVRNYVATIRVAPIVESDTAFVEWWATFDCAAEEYDRWTNHFEKEGFAKWLSALRHFMATGNKNGTGAISVY